MSILYFDSNIHRYFGKAFATASLAHEVRRHIWLSPVSILEVASQIGTGAEQEAFDAFQAMRNWTTQDTKILPWSNAFLRKRIFNLPPPDDTMSEGFIWIANAIINASSPADVKDLAVNLRAYYEGERTRIASHHKQGTEGIRTDGGKFDRDDRSRVFFEQMAVEAEANPDGLSIPTLVSQLEAYHAFHMKTFDIALAHPDYNFFSLKNTSKQLDAQQLLYLNVTHLHFVTCDGDFKRDLDTEQGKRIHIADAAQMCDPIRAQAFLVDILEAWRAVPGLGGAEL